MKSRDHSYEDIEQKLKLKTSKPFFKRKLFWLVVVIMAGSLWGYKFLWPQNNQPAFSFQTSDVRKGDLTVTVSATGTLEPVNQVDIGVEVSGTVAEVLVDFNDEVKVNDVLARLDTTKFEAQVLQSKAALESAKAKLLESEADVFQTGKDLERQKRARKLSGGKTPSQAEMDSAIAANKRAQASAASAKAQIAQAQATLKMDETDLSKAVIRSPISGIVLSREVESGQTVAASLSTPVLFSLAEDLTRMELHVSVDEADIGQVKEGQEATFTVDAYPEGDFTALVTQVRYASETEDGVVTYETLLQVGNQDLRLRPGMTATAEITVKKVRDALLAPNNALRFSPKPSHVEASPKRGGGFMSLMMPRPPGRNARPKAEPEAKNGKRRVWTIKDGIPVPIPVKVGMTDGLMTEILEGDLSPGQALITDMTGPGK